MEKVIGVRFKRVGKIYYFLAGKIHFEQGDHAIVETSKGTEFGEVVIAEKEVEEKDLVAPLKQVIRRANSKDDKKLEENKHKEKKAFETCTQKIEKHELQMKLVDVEYTFDNAKIVFYFTADGRVDFRDLVKDLASVFKTRIELRQIGVRDEAKMLGGLGPCGRVCCCSYFLGDFNPVSIKMAKEQNLSLSPTKISGLCGRLMCCLNYEHDHYCKTRLRMPKPGSTVDTPDGRGVVLDNNAITEKVRVRITLPDENIEVKSFPLEDIKTLGYHPPFEKNKGKKNDAVKNSDKKKNNGDSKSPENKKTAKDKGSRKNKDNKNHNSYNSNAKNHKNNSNSKGKKPRDNNGKKPDNKNA